VLVAGRVDRREQVEQAEAEQHEGDDVDRVGPARTDHRGAATRDQQQDGGGRDRRAGQAALPEEPRLHGLARVGVLRGGTREPAGRARTAERLRHGDARTTR